MVDMVTRLTPVERTTVETIMARLAVGGIEGGNLEKDAGADGYDRTGWGSKC